MVERLSRRWHLDADDAAAIRKLPHVLRELEPRQPIVREGELARQSCLLVSGVASREKVVGSGERQIVAIHLRGELIDLHNSFLRLADHNVQTLSQAEIASIPREELQALALARPSVGMAMWLDTLVDGAIQREWTANIGRRSSMARVAHLICELALRLEAAGLATRERFDLPVTQEALADCVALTAVHVNRTLRLLEEHGLERLGTRSFRIADWKRLAAAGDFTPDYLHLPGRA